MLGAFDGHIRMVPVEHPYNNIDTLEIGEDLRSSIMLSLLLIYIFLVIGKNNGKEVSVRAYTRVGEAQINNWNDIVNKEMPNLMSPSKPFLFTIIVFHDGHVKLVKDNEVEPFLEFYHKHISLDFVSFPNWNQPVNYFFDCPLSFEEQV